VPERYGAARGLTPEQALAELLPHFTGLAHTLPWYCTDHWSRLTGLDIAGLKRETRERVRVLDGTVEFLTAVRASGRQLWLATNAHRDSWQVKLEKTGLAHYFDAIVCSHDYGAPKESQTFWNALMAERPFVRERAFFADDSLPVLRGAQGFGIGQLRAIACPEIDGPRRSISEFAAVDRLADLLPVQ
jgi:putative hydrolase of the HAD superfamily